MAAWPPAVRVACRVNACAALFCYQKVKAHLFPCLPAGTIAADATAADVPLTPPAGRVDSGAPRGSTQRARGGRKGVADVPLSFRCVGCTGPARMSVPNFRKYCFENKNHKQSQCAQATGPWDSPPPAMRRCLFTGGATALRTGAPCGVAPLPFGKAQPHRLPPALPPPNPQPPPCPRVSTPQMVATSGFVHTVIDLLGIFGSAALSAAAAARLRWAVVSQPHPSVLGA